MKVDSEAYDMQEGRALLTEREREALADKDDNNYRYKTRTYFRARLEALEEDIAVLESHDPELLKQLRKVVCSTDSGGFNEIQRGIETSLDDPAADSDADETQGGE